MKLNANKSFILGISYISFAVGASVADVIVRKSSGFYGNWFHIIFIFVYIALPFIFGILAGKNMEKQNASKQRITKK